MHKSPVVNRGRDDFSHSAETQVVDEARRTDVDSGKDDGRTIEVLDGSKRLGVADLDVVNAVDAWLNDV
jgi:hypothetical protein